MKKSNSAIFIALLLALIMLCALSAGCADGGEENSRTGPDVQSGEASDAAEDGEVEKPTLTVLCDFAERNPGGDIHQVLMSTQGMSDYELKMEYVPTNEPDRSNFITRAGIGLMSGKGADVFIVDCYMGNLLNTSEGCMFPYPQKAMKNHLFLSLDDYIGNAQYMEWDKLLPAVMEAGRNNEGQQILPMSYALCAVTCKKDGYELPDPMPETREEMLASGNSLLKFMARPTYDNILMPMGSPADFVEEELNFTEDELFDLTMDFYDRVQDGYGGYDWHEAVRQEVGNVLYSDSFDYTSIEDELMVVATPNRTGGVTAGVTVYGAVNRNTDHPDMAFTVLDKLLASSTMRSTNVYGRLYGMPVNTEVGDYDNRFMWGNSWYMNDWNFEQYCKVRDRIDSVKFYTPLDQEAEDTLIEACRAGDADEDSIRRAVHSAYTTMKMMLAES